MEQREFVQAVAERSSLSREESADVTRAVLDALADQLSEGEARRLAADLPGVLPGSSQAPRRRRRGDAAGGAPTPSRSRSSSGRSAGARG